MNVNAAPATSVHKKNSNYLFVALLFFLIFPILSLPFILIGIYNREKKAYWMMALFLGLVAILYPPSGDFYRYSLIFDAIKDDNFYAIFLYRDTHTFDFFLDIMCYIVASMGLTVEYVRAIYTFLGSLLLFNIYGDVCERNRFLSNNKSRSFSFFLCLLVLCNFGHVFLYRWFLSVMMLVYGIFMVDIYRKKSGFVWFLLSIINHWGMILVVIAYIIQKIKRVNLSTTILIICLIAIFTQALTLINYVVSSLPLGDFQKYLSGYTDGYWANEFMTERSFKGLIAEYLNQLLFWLLFVFFIFESKDKINRPLKSFCHTIILLTTLVSGSFMLVGRYGAFLKYVGIIYFFLFYKPEWYKFYRLITISTIILFMTSLYGNRRGYIYGYSGKIFTSSLYDIATTKYSDSWIKSNLSDDGNEFIKD